MARNSSPVIPGGGRGKKACAVVVDGETEKIYIEQLRAHERVSVQPVKADDDITKQYAQVQNLHNTYAEVYWLMDYDVIARDNRENPVETNKKLTKLKQCLVEAAKEPWLHILFNSPCLEYWLLLHYEPRNRRSYESYEGDLKTALRAHMADYEKSRKYYESGTGLYRKLRPHLATAMQSAATIQFDPTAGACAPAAELHRLLTALRVG